MSLKRRRIKVEYKKLGKEQAWGQADIADETIELDSRLKGKKHLEILIHEALHILHPKMAEEVIVKNSICLTNLIWGQQYRRIETDTSIPLQDGKK